MAKEKKEVVEETIEQPIELGLEDISNSLLYIKVYGFKTYAEITDITKEFNINFNITTENKDNKFNILIGPIANEDANNLVSSFISKGYKKTEIVLE